MTFEELTRAWCLEDGSVWHRLQHIAELDCLVEGIAFDVETHDQMNAIATRNPRERVIFYDSTAPTLIETYQNILSSNAAGGTGRFLGLPTRDAAERKKLALRLARLTTDFIVLHEIAHLARRHLYAPFAGVSLLELAEFHATGTPRKSMSALQHRALEADADICSLALMSMLLPSMAERTHHYIFPNPRITTQILRFTLFTFFNISGTRKSLDVIAYEKDESTAHPHPAIRARILENYIPRLIETGNSPWKERFSRIHDWLVLRRSTVLLKSANLPVPLSDHYKTHLDFIKYRGNTILNLRETHQPRWTTGSRWEESLRRLNAVT